MTFVRIAAWSGPRNISTALMYAFSARADCAAVDEPFYAAFLHETGLDHPMRDAVLASQPIDPGVVAADLARDGAPHRYLKLMAHHMTPAMPLGWAEGCAQLHLIRHPARVAASYAAKRDAPTEADLGYLAQAALYDRLGGVVLDTTDLRADPEGMLRALCDALGAAWDAAMLSWPAGPKPCDGAWAPHWYGAVHRSTGFAPPEGPPPGCDRADLMRATMPLYEALRDRRLRPAASR